MRKVLFTVFIIAVIITGLCNGAHAKPNGSLGCDCNSCHSYADQCVTNSAPRANAGVDQSVKEGGIVTLDGSNSSDPDGIIASYAWKVMAGPAVALSNAAAAKPTFTAPTAGTSGTPLTFQLTIADNGGQTATDTCVVNVTAANQPPVANAGADQTVNEGIMVTLNGANSTDPDGTIRSHMLDTDSRTVSNPVEFNCRSTQLHCTECGDRRRRITHLSVDGHRQRRPASHR